MSSYSNAGTYKLFPLTTTGDVAFTGDGHAFSVAIVNNSNGASAAGNIQFQGGAALPNDPCAVDVTTFADLLVAPECDAPNNAAPVVAGVAFSATNSLPAKSQCHLSWPCNARFLRLKANPPAGVVVVVVVTQLRNQ